MYRAGSPITAATARAFLSRRRFIIPAQVGLLIVTVSPPCAALTGITASEKSASAFAPELLPQSVFQIVTSRGTATGFVLPGGRLVTTARALDGAEAASIRMPAGQPDVSFERVLALDRDADLAVLALPASAQGMVGVKTGASARLKTGEALRVVGASLAGQPPVVTEATLSGRVKAPNGLDLLRLSVEVPLTSSGAPVLNAKGEVIGMALPISGGTGGGGGSLVLPVETLLARAQGGIPLRTLTGRGTAETGGGGRERIFATLNGTPIPLSEYVRALERQSVAVPGGSASVTAERVVIDQIIGNRILMTEAEKLGVVPSDEEVNRYYVTQKALYERQNPGRDYEASMKAQGTTPEEVKIDLKIQLAEMAIYAQRLGITEKEISEAFEKGKTKDGLTVVPERVQFRVVLAAPDSAEFKEAKKLLEDEKKPFEEVARQVNVPQLKATAGLVPQITAVPQIPLSLQGRFMSTKEGGVFGPVDFTTGPNQPPMKAWIKVERKYPSFSLPLSEATPLLRRQIVQQRVQQPEGAKVRAEIMQKKIDARFEPTDPEYNEVWQSVKQQAAHNSPVLNPPAPGPSAPGTPLGNPSPPPR